MRRWGERGRGPRGIAAICMVTRLRQQTMTTGTLKFGNNCHYYFDSVVHSWWIKSRTMVNNSRQVYVCEHCDDQMKSKQELYKKQTKQRHTTIKTTTTTTTNIPPMQTVRHIRAKIKNSLCLFFRLPCKVMVLTEDICHFELFTNSYQNCPYLYFNTVATILQLSKKTLT